MFCLDILPKDYIVACWNAKLNLFEINIFVVIYVSNISFFYRYDNVDINGIILNLYEENSTFDINEFTRFYSLC